MPADAAIVVSDVDLVPVFTGRDFLNCATKPISERGKKGEESYEGTVQMWCRDVREMEEVKS